MKKIKGAVTQLARVSRSQRGCRGFESHQLHHKNFKPLIERLLFFMVERSRKASLHAAAAALHSKPKVFFTSSPIPVSLACEDIRSAHL